MVLGYQFMNKSTVVYHLEQILKYKNIKLNDEIRAITRAIEIIKREAKLDKDKEIKLK